MKLLRALVVFTLTLTPFAVSAATSPAIFGDWTTPDGSVVRTFPCASALCIRIVAIAATAPGKVDNNNPDPALRTRSLCDLEIGNSFTLSGAMDEANSGHLYDPESGKTYKGNITLRGNTMFLRGYIGLSVFGRTETWHRAGSVKTCG